MPTVWMPEQLLWKVCASEKESRWISDIDLQYAKRPIPNQLKWSGHSCEALSYLLQEEHCIFTGDAIPVRGDIPIWIQKEDNRKSLEKLKELERADLFYPAWDMTYTKEEAKRKIEDALILMDEIQKTVIQYREKTESLDELVIKVCNTMGTPGFRKNPLFKRTIESFME